MLNPKIVNKRVK